MFDQSSIQILDMCQSGIIFLRGYRYNIDEAHDQSLYKQIQLEPWSDGLISYAQSQGWWIGIFSDFPQPSLSGWFKQVHIHHIAIGMDTGCLKPFQMVATNSCRNSVFVVHKHT